MNLFSKKTSKLEKYKSRYCNLMRKAFKVAPKDKEKSDALNAEAKQILADIRRLEAAS